MPNHSLWIDTVEIDSFPMLDHDIDCDVVVVGGGLAGILTAYKAQCAGLKTVLIEKDRIGQGITANTTAVVTLEHEVLYSEFIKKIGREKTKQYLDANQEAIKEYRKLSRRFSFDYETKDNCVYSTTDEQAMKSECRVLNELGVDAQFIDKVEIPLAIKGGVRIPDQGQMNPLKLIKELSKLLTIYEHTTAIKISQAGVMTNNGFIKAAKIVIATHFPFIDRHGFFFAKMYQKRSYVMAIKDGFSLQCTYTNYDDKDFYFRNYQDYLLIGGNDHRCGESGDCYSSIEKFIKNNYQRKEIIYSWSNQDCITIDEVPYFGSYSLIWKNVYVITGFNLWGMTQAMIGANVICDLLLNKKNKYQDLYHPSRFFIKKQLWKNLSYYIKHLLSFKKPRCSHMGCVLVYNHHEKIWDCPCHGSCFDEHHNVIHNPTTKPFK